jgi:hypothetical protein
MHGWYEIVAFLDKDNERKLACWLGPVEDYGGGDAVLLEEEMRCSYSLSRPSLSFEAQSGL